MAKDFCPFIKGTCRSDCMLSDAITGKCCIISDALSAIHSDQKTFMEKIIALLQQMRHLVIIPPPVPFEDVPLEKIASENCTFEDILIALAA
jgi:hypothetical protein